MKQLRALLDKVLNVLSGASFLLMVALTCWQVFTRYILQNPSSWSEELVAYLFAWMALLGASAVVGERGHMNIPIIVDMMKPGMKKAFHIFSEIIGLGFAAVILVYGGVQITSLAMGQMTSSLGVAIGVFYVVLPISGVLNCIYSVLNIVDLIKGTSEQALDETAAALANAEKAMKELEEA